VADAWQDSASARTWKAGYHPLAATVRPPSGGWHSGLDQQAWATGNFVLSGTLPDGPHRNGRIGWKHGPSLFLPLTSARRTYAALATAHIDGAPRLTVTGVRLGGTTLLTGRGPASVPAWLFTLKGYDTPLVVAAVAPSKPPRPPIRSLAGQSAQVLAPLAGLAALSRDGRSVTVLANHGSCDGGSAVDVLEAQDSVVLSAHVAASRQGPCTAVMITATVTLALRRPVGERILLDACTGRPVPYAESNRSLSPGT
jgi:hypothetical protein